jgi:hypothetical protein
LVTAQANLGAKFPDAAAAADAEVNTTASTSVRSRLFGFNGATWDRLRAGLTALTATFTGFLNTLPFGVYHAVPTTRTEGQGGPSETDAQGNLRVAEQVPPAFEYAPDAACSTHEKPAASAQYNAIPYDIIAKANQGIIKAAPGNLYTVHFTNTAATAKTVALVNKATAPTSDAPVTYFQVPPNSTLRVEYKFGKRFATGIAWAQCTTAGAATITLDTADTIVTAECM